MMFLEEYTSNSKTYNSTKQLDKYNKFMANKRRYKVQTNSPLTDNKLPEMLTYTPNLKT